MAFRILINILLAMFICQKAAAQDIEIISGKKQLPITEYFTISLKIRGKVAAPITTATFPEITGFKKSNLFSRSYRVKAANNTYTEEIITQNYAALQEGKILIRPFVLKIGAKSISSKAFAVTVLPEPAKATTPEIPEDIVVTAKPLKPEEIKSYLSLETNKNQLYEGEGVQLHLYFYLASSEQGLLDFHQFSQQFASLSKKLKQPHAWEEVVAVNEEKPDTLKINNIDFIRFKLYQSTLYPLIAKPFQFPTLVLNMQVRAKDQQYATPGKESQIIPFSSKPRTVTVRALPPHPNKKAVAVGKFELQEGINRSVFETDKSFLYSFVITGEGNFSAVTMPDVINMKGLEVFAPVISQNELSNRKEFKYTILPKAAGNYNLGTTFQFPFFNVVTGRYDTLHSELAIRVRGAANSISKVKPGSTDAFYKLIEEEKNELTSLHAFDQIKLYTNVVVLFLLCASLFLFLKK